MDGSGSIDYKQMNSDLEGALTDPDATEGEITNNPNVLSPKKDINYKETKHHL